MSLKKSKQKLQRFLEYHPETQKLFTWFANNQMKANHDKCHLLLSTQEKANIQTANTTIKRSQSENILGIILKNQLKFDQHVENICQKASRKLNAIAKVTNYMELPKRRILINAFCKAQFNYCPAVWMLFGCFTVAL